MRGTLSVRLDPEQAAWLEERARQTGRPVGAIVREEIDRARGERPAPGFKRLAGGVKRDPKASERKGFSRR